MPVSLKKPSESVKVDLSKPVSDKLPECTPVHLLDEEETIKSRTSQPKIPIKQIRLFHSEEEDREIWDKYFEILHRERVKRDLIVTVAVVSVIVLVTLIVVVFLFNFKLPDIELDSVSDLFAVMFNFLDYLGESFLFKFLIVFSCIGFGLHLMRSLININRR